MEYIFQDTVVERKNIFKGNDSYTTFLFDVIEKYACCDLHGTAIIHSYSICQYIQINRNGELAYLNDEQIADRLIGAARLGAWTAWLIGDTHYFDLLTEIMESVTEKKPTAFGLMIQSVMDGHRNAKFVGDNADASKAYSSAYKLANAINDEDNLAKISKDSHVIKANIVRAQIAQGNGLKSKVPLLSKTIAEILHELENAETNEYYKLIFRLNVLIDKSDACMNEDRMEEAFEYLKSCNKLISEPGYEDYRRSWAKYYSAMGRYEYIKTGIFDNNYIQAAKSLYFEMADNYSIRNLNKICKVVD